MIEIRFDKNKMNDKVFYLTKKLYQSASSSLEGRKNVVKVHEGGLYFFNGFSGFEYETDISQLGERVLYLHPDLICKLYDQGDGVSIMYDEETNNIKLMLGKKIKVRTTNIDVELPVLLRKEDIVPLSPSVYADFIVDLKLVKEYYTNDYTKPALMGIYYEEGYLFAGTNVGMMMVHIGDKLDVENKIFFPYNFVEYITMFDKIIGLFKAGNMTGVYLNKKKNFLFFAVDSATGLINIWELFSNMNIRDNVLGVLEINDETTDAFNKVVNVLSKGGEAPSTYELVFGYHEDAVQIEVVVPHLNANIKSSITGQKAWSEEGLKVTVEMVTFMKLLNSKYYEKILIFSDRLIFLGANSRGILLRRGR